MGIRAVANYTGKRSCHRMPGGGFDSASELILAFNGPKVWYDLSNVATLQQDSAGTIPVALAGDPIGRVMDISGANNHATQAVALSCPLWQTTFAAFDGVNDSWATPAIDFTATNQLTVIVGIRKLSDAASAAVTELSASVSLNTGAFTVWAPLTAAANFTTSASGLTAASNALASGNAAPKTAVVSGQFALSPGSNICRVNGASGATSATALGGGTFGNYPLYIGRRGGTTLPLNGNLYGVIILGRAVSTAELRILENYMAGKAGIVI